MLFRSESGGNLIEIEKGEIFQVTPDGNRKRFSVVRRENAREYHDLGQTISVVFYCPPLSSFAPRRERKRARRAMKFLISLGGNSGRAAGYPRKDFFGFLITPLSFHTMRNLLTANIK